VNGELTIGRAAGCGVSLPDDTFVSNVHARVYERDGDVFVEDLGSTNGSLVNGATLTSATKLRKGDRIQVGQTVLEATR
jgi:pSer/pThr/pTyr-binding forkhead associated (FHA) protein